MRISSCRRAKAESCGIIAKGAGRASDCERIAAASGYAAASRETVGSRGCRTAAEDGTIGAAGYSTNTCREACVTAGGSVITDCGTERADIGIIPFCSRHAARTERTFGFIEEHAVIIIGTDDVGQLRRAEDEVVGGINGRRARADDGAGFFPDPRSGDGRSGEAVQAVFVAEISSARRTLDIDEKVLSAAAGAVIGCGIADADLATLQECYSVGG